MRYAILLSALLWAIITLVVYIVVNFPDCQREDSSNCYWNASTMGNGEGQSFINIADVTWYVD